MDDTDKKILKLLQADGRLTNQQLSDHINISPAACWRRVKSLENAGIITGYVARLEPEAAGVGLTAFLQISLQRHSRDAAHRFEARVEEVDEVLECHSVAGTTDYLLKVAAKNIREYENLLNDIVFDLPGVDQVHSLISLRPVKESMAYPL